MRLIALDIETTGISPLRGDRIVEIGAVEVVDGKLYTKEKNVFHQYINPERHIPDVVVRIHGIDDTKVKDKPVFKDIAREFLDFIKGSTLVIHNASFDLGFIMNELHLNGFENNKHPRRKQRGIAVSVILSQRSKLRGIRPAEIKQMQVIDTLAFARKKHPHQRNNLDALCDRYNIERGHRALHGSLLDSELLAEVYLAIIGEDQLSPGIDIPCHPASFFVQRTLTD